MDPDPPRKNPREFTWTVDTLIAHPDAIQTQMWDIYATSPQYVYVVGHTDWTGVNGSGIMWRYDGTSWSIVNQGFRDISLESITGFGPSNVYAAGNKGPEAIILHYDGAIWTQQTLPGRPLSTVRGDNSSNLWTGGSRGTVFQFDGAQWIKVVAEEGWFFKDLAVSGGNVFGIAYRLDEEPFDTTWFYSLSWTGQQWDTLGVWLSLSLYPYTVTFGAQSLSIVGGELYSAGTTLSVGPGLFKMASEKWVEVPGDIRVAKAFGISKDNLFGAGTNGTLYHYNGSDWYEFEQFRPNEFDFWSGWTDGNEVFVVGHDFRKSIVLHGK